MICSSCLLYARYWLPSSISCVKMTVSVLCAGLGLGASSTGRRDSFDRNTSAFSPSLEYSRAKWPQSYGALGKNRFVVCEMYSDIRGVASRTVHLSVLVAQKTYANDHKSWKENYHHCSFCQLFLSSHFPIRSMRSEKYFPVLF